MRASPRQPTAARETQEHVGPAIERLVRTLYESFVAGDRATFESLLAPDFRFTSPYDDAIDRASFFERCWPNHDRQRSVSFDRIVVAGDIAYVTYQLELVDGRRIRNTEVLTFREGQVVRTDVYFGATRDRRGTFLPMSR